jgi:hypothetical protein
MTAHELARQLLQGPDLPVCLSDWAQGDNVPTLCETLVRNLSVVYSVWVEEEGSFKYSGDTDIVLLDSSGHPWDEPEGGWQSIDDYSNLER